METLFQELKRYVLWDAADEAALHALHPVLAKELVRIARIGEQLTISNNIISGLLDMIRDKPLVRERLRLAALLDGALSSLAVPEGVRVRAEGLAELPELEGDATQLQQVLRNLLENAVHAVGKSGEIAVSGRALLGKIELTVSDSGPGVDPAIRKRLFEPLISARAGGIGLGLSLVKRFVERHGGTIAYVGDGAGARFVILLPARAAGGFDA